MATGARLYGKGAETPMTPASTIKIATAVAALTALGPDHRIPTTVVAAPDAEGITLVGGGDATLERAGLARLADRTARALRDRGITKVRLAYDTSLYQGPALHPIGRNGNLAPISALMVDQEGAPPRAPAARPARPTPPGTRPGCSPSCLPAKASARRRTLPRAVPRRTPSRSPRCCRGPCPQWSNGC